MCKLKSNFLANLLIMLAITLMLAACAGSPPKLYLPKTPPPLPTKFTKKPQVVLVLGSGGARGYAHLGVLQALTYAHIPIDTIICASAGCIVGALYADNNNARKTYDAMMNASFWDFADISNFPSLKGFVKGYHLEKFLLKHMHAKTFSQLKTRLIVATTDLKNGEPYLIESGPVAPAILASSALPGLVQPVHLYGKILVDGGVASPVPARFAKNLHPKLIISVNIAEELKHEIPHTAYGIYERAYNIMWQRQTDASLNGSNIVIRPEVGQVSTFDLDDKYKLYLEGLRVGNAMVPSILEELHKKHIPLTQAQHIVPPGK